MGRLGFRRGVWWRFCVALSGLVFVGGCYLGRCPRLGCFSPSGWIWVEVGWVRGGELGLGVER